LVANKANSELLDFVLDAGLYQGLEEDHDCWALQLMHGLQLADPDTDWETHMLQLKAIDSPKGVTRLAKQKFAASIQMFDSDPTDPVCPLGGVEHGAPLTCAADVSLRRSMLRHIFRHRWHTFRNSPAKTQPQPAQQRNNTHNPSSQSASCNFVHNAPTFHRPRHVPVGETLARWGKTQLQAHII
jgi:hypothetical protein